MPTIEFELNIKQFYNLETKFQSSRAGSFSHLIPDTASCDWNQSLNIVSDHTGIAFRIAFH